MRGALVARLGELLTAHQQDLATLVTVEVGKITAEARGEVQEMIDVCQFSVGLSRQLYGRTIASERAGHRLLETWHPLGVVGVITAFNFPVAVWAWNTAVALVCGDTVVWKPSELTPLTALASSACYAITDVGAHGRGGRPAVGRRRAWCATRRRPAGCVVVGDGFGVDGPAGHALRPALRAGAAGVGRQQRGHCGAVGRPDGDAASCSPRRTQVSAAPACAG
ncbi:piperideine-6-carboxylic acid dehydrogenase [Mycobacterium tuberculosis CAS/NITR204]|uniref:Piperideine-6-carboxylic acid dehydrogenase n=1 Tax=Mycobacterium tuberculosis CAS/NITR204 TaxID=1310114 RepID=R4ML98_MYCTX|nr:piperideine-6-carboxylic acid dehydrogenase [Mycobacterium tuberculosis CAS/NITR204]